MQKSHQKERDERFEHKNTPSASSQNPEADDDLSRAVLESEKQQSLLPLVKQELKYKIRYKRLSEGKEEFVPDEPRPTSYELTEYERQKIEERRRQNRQSAQRSRKKSEDYEENLKKKINNLSKLNIKLAKERGTLLQTKARLLSEFRNIGCFPSLRVCSCGIRSDPGLEVAATETKAPSE